MHAAENLSTEKSKQEEVTRNNNFARWKTDTRKEDGVIALPHVSDPVRKNGGSTRPRRPPRQSDLGRGKTAGLVVWWCISIDLNGVVVHASGALIDFGRKRSVKGGEQSEKKASCSRWWSSLVVTGGLRFVLALFLRDRVLPSKARFGSPWEASFSGPRMLT